MINKWSIDKAKNVKQINKVFNPPIEPTDTITTSGNEKTIEIRVNSSHAREVKYNVCGIQDAPKNFEHSKSDKESDHEQTTRERKESNPHPPNEPKRRGRKKGKSISLSKGNICIGKGKRKKTSIVLPTPASKRVEDEDKSPKYFELFKNGKDPSSNNFNNDS